MQRKFGRTEYGKRKEKRRAWERILTSLVHNFTKIIFHKQIQMEGNCIRRLVCILQKDKVIKTN